MIFSMVLKTILIKYPTLIGGENQRVQRAGILTVKNDKNCSLQSYEWSF